MMLTGCGTQFTCSGEIAPPPEREFWCSPFQKVGKIFSVQKIYRTEPNTKNDKLEKQTRHDVNAYIDNVSKYIGKQSKYFHHGVTSSDIIDTGFSIQLKQTGEVISRELNILIKKKDPSEYIQKLRFHNSIERFEEYLND